MVVRITYAVARQIANHAQADYPNEVCGLLAGVDHTIQSAIPISNIAQTPQTNYQMNPNDEIKALKQIDADGLDWIGIYHSHPKSSPIPSQTDINNSSDPQLFHLIVSLKDSKPKLKLWQIHTDHVSPIELMFDTQSPDDNAHEPLSNTQKVAIILTGILSVIMMLAISFSLLPPAPQITPIP